MRRLLVFLAVSLILQLAGSVELTEDTSPTPETSSDAAPVAEALPAPEEGEEGEALDDESAAPEEEAVDDLSPPVRGLDAAPAAAPTSDTAQVQFMVTRKMQARLAELGYSQSESEQLVPERAAAIIERSIRRPASGVPAAWKRGASGPKGGLAILQRCKAAIPALCLAPLVWQVSRGRPAAKAIRISAPVAAQIPPLTPPVASPPPPPLAPGEFWLDRQFDRLMDWLALQISKLRKQ